MLKNTNGIKVYAHSLIEVMCSATAVRSRFQLLQWLQGEFQEILSHDAFISARGDFMNSHLYADVISPVLGLGDGKRSSFGASELCSEFLSRWVQAGEQPVSMQVLEGYCGDDIRSSVHSLLSQMRYAVFHVIRDRRMKVDYLYAFLRQKGPFTADERRFLGLVLPHVDFATRRIDACNELEPYGRTNTHESSSLELAGLTLREIEILDWVRCGKTNIEIGMILDISAFTVKNHLQRIFRKMNVSNRAHAVSVMDRISSGEITADHGL